MRVNAPLPALAAQPAVQITLFSVTSAQVCENTFQYITAGPAIPATSDLNQLAQDFWSLISAQAVLVTTGQTTFTQVTAALISSNNVPTGLYTLPGATVGAVAGSSLPLEMGAIMAKQTNVRGQHGRGRITLPAVPISFTTPATDPNIINAAGLTAYLNLANKFNAVLISGGVTWNAAVVTRPIPPAAVATNGTPILRVVTRALLGTARRRREGRGI